MSERKIERYRHAKCFKSGVTLLELMIVVVIISLGGTMAYSGFRKDIENREAKQAISSLKTIAYAARLYKMEKKTNPVIVDNLYDTTGNAGYINKNELFPKYDYSENNPSQFVAVSQSTPARTITYTLGDNSSLDTIVDSAGVYNFP